MNRARLYHLLRAEMLEAQAKVYAIEAAACRVDPYNTEEKRVANEFFHLGLAQSYREQAAQNLAIAETYS